MTDSVARGHYGSAWTLAATTTTVGTTAVNFTPFSQILSIAASGVTYTAPGGTSRTQATRNAERVYVTDYGAKCDNSTDDINAINLALSNVPAGGTLYLPNSFCAVSTTIVRATPITIIGAGMYTSGFTLLSGASSLTDLFSISPTINTLQRGFSFTNMAFQIANTGGRSAVIINTSASSSTSAAEVVFDKVYLLSQSTAANNYGLLLLNGTNPNGGIFNFTFKNGIINGGAFLISSGDTLRFQNNIITGPNAGVGGSQISNAGNLVIENNNVSSVGGGVVLTCSYAPRIFHNEFEQQVTSTEANNAIVDLVASVCTMQGSSITENQIQADGGVGNPTLVRISSNNLNVKLDSNNLATPQAYAAVVNGSANLFCGNNTWGSASPHVSGTPAAAAWSNGC